MFEIGHRDDLFNLPQTKLHAALCGVIEVARMLRSPSMIYPGREELQLPMAGRK